MADGRIGDRLIGDHGLAGTDGAAWTAVWPDGAAGPGAGRCGGWPAAVIGGRAGWVGIPMMMIMDFPSTVTGVTEVIIVPASMSDWSLAFTASAPVTS
jgi:hypothetical protein